MAEELEKREQKYLYMRPSFIVAFEDLVYAQKRAKGKTQPELAEEAIKLLLAKYNVNISDLEKLL